MSDDFPRGRFIWHEILTTDVEAAQAFYTRIAGWGTDLWRHEELPPYHMFTLDGTPYAGAHKLPDEAVAAGAPPHWIAYVAVPDVDAAVERTKERGGEVRMGPMDVPTVGRVAVLTDPQGAMFGVYRPAGEVGGHDGAPELGEVSWHELATTDWEAAFDFYHDLFGWQKISAVDMGEMGTYQMYNRVPDVPLGGMFDKPAEMPGPPVWVNYIRVEDVHATAEEVKAAGGQVINGPMEVPGGDWIAQCLDPQGAFFAIHHKG